MTLKLTGIIFIFITSSAVGFRMSEALAERERYTRMIMMLLGHISDLIEFSSMHMQDILVSLACDVNYQRLEFIKKAVSYTGRGMHFDKAWNKAVDEDKMIGKREREILKMAGSSLGTSGRKSQIAMLALHSHTISEILDSGAEEVKNKRKLFSSLGVLAGALISVLLI